MQRRLWPYADVALSPFSALSTISVIAMTASSSCERPISCKPTGHPANNSGESVNKRRQERIYRAVLEHSRMKRTMVESSLVLVIVKLVWRMWLINVGIDKGDREHCRSVVHGIA